MPKETISNPNEGDLVRLKYTFRFGDQFIEPDDDWLKCIEATSDELLGPYSKAEDNALSAAFRSRKKKRLNRVFDAIGFLYHQDGVGGGRTRKVRNDQGEEPTQTYNRLKTLVNKIRSYKSTRWTDHDVVRLMLRSFTILDPHLVNSIHENPRYTKMTPEEILRKFVSGRMMIKEARYVDEALNGPMPIHEPQTIALKATSSREALPSKVAQVEAVGLNEEEMTLIIKRFKTALKGRKEYSNKNKAKRKRSCFKCGKQGH